MSEQVLIPPGLRSLAGGRHACVKTGLLIRPSQRLRHLYNFTSLALYPSLSNSCRLTLNFDMLPMQVLQVVITLINKQVTVIIDIRDTKRGRTLQYSGINVMLRCQCEKSHE